MCDVVCGIRPSIHVAYQSSAEEIGVSVCGSPIATYARADVCSGLPGVTLTLLSVEKVGDFFTYSFSLKNIILNQKVTNMSFNKVIDHKALIIQKQVYSHLEKHLANFLHHKEIFFLQINKSTT